jgi:malonate decarboxylase gamma subunit
MDMPSISRVTKLPIDMLKRMSASTPVFAPGLANMQAMGAVTETWDADRSLRDQLLSLLQRVDELPADERDRAGQQHGGRMKAALIAEAVMQQALRGRVI